MRRVPGPKSSVFSGGRTRHSSAATAREQSSVVLDTEIEGMQGQRGSAGEARRSSRAGGRGSNVAAKGMGEGGADLRVGACGLGARRPMRKSNGR